LEKLENEAGLDVIAIPSFSNGYEFEKMEIDECTKQDENNNDILSYRDICINYVKDNEPHVAIYMEPEEMESGDSSEVAQAIRNVGDVNIYYHCDEYLYVPVGETLTDEEKERDANDPHFFISDGSEEREKHMISFAGFVLDGVSYCILSSDTSMNADEMMDMAEEIINAR
jgi:hypothetical protein